MKEKGASPVFFQHFYRFRLMFRFFIHFKLILLYSIRKGFSFSHLLVNIWFYDTLYWKGYPSLFCALAPLWMLSFHMCMHYCLCSLFCSVGCLPANQFLLFWLLWFQRIFCNYRVWCLWIFLLLLLLFFFLKNRLF